MSEKVTFGCGTFLPGLGPGNVTQFDGGGTIDSGGGNDPPDPPEPPDPGDIDPDPIGDDGGGITPGPGVPPIGPPVSPPGSPTIPGPPTPVSPGGTSKCVCVVNVPPNEVVIPVSPGDGNGTAPGATHMVIRTYSQSCTQVATQNEVQQARSRNNQILNSQAPPPGGGQWILVAGPIQSGSAGQSCKTAQGCGGACPNITVRTFWKKRGTPTSGGDTPGRPVDGGPGPGGGTTPGGPGVDIGGGGSVPPGPGGGGGITPGPGAGDAGGASPPPPGPGDGDTGGGITPGPDAGDKGGGAGVPPPGPDVTPGGDNTDIGGGAGVPPPGPDVNPGGPGIDIGPGGPIGGDNDPGPGGGISPGPDLPNTPPNPGQIGGGLESLCIITNDSPVPNEFINSGGETYTVTVRFPQSCFEGLEPAFAETARQRNTDLVTAASTQPPQTFAGPWVQVGPPQVDGPVNTSCTTGAGCGDIVVTTIWRRVQDEPDTDPDDAGGVPTIEFLTQGGGDEGFAGDGLRDEGLPASEFATRKPITSKKYTSQEDISQQALRSGSLNLNDPDIINSILKKKPYGVQDSTIAFLTNPPAPKMVSNNSGYERIFKDPIDSNLLYVLQNAKNEGNWDSRRAAGITPQVIYDSLTDEVLDILERIRNYDGSPLTQVQIFNMIGSRALDGTLKSLSIAYLEQLAQDSEKRVPVTITRSSNNQVNEVVALSLIEKNMFSLDPNSIDNTRDAELLRNWKVVPSDVDMYIPFQVGDSLERFYINDDETFIDRVTLSLQDGNFFDIQGGPLISQRLFAESEVDHAYYIPESTRQKAIQILGGEPGRTLTVSADAPTASSIEYDSSLTSPREPYYLLSGVLSSLETSPSLGSSYLLKDSTMEYRLIDTTTREGKAAADEYIRYKANKRVFVLDHEDLILDYIEETGSVSLSQTDILFDSPKENKTIPLLTRQIPWYIMVVPTNRPDYNIFNSKSKIRDITSGGSITRELRCKTSIVPEFSKRQTNKFIKYSTVGKDGVDVLGDNNTQARQTIIEVNDSDFNKTYNVRGKLVGTEDYEPNRDKTPIRIVREIINELDTNYELSINGIGKSLTEFDVFSRLTVKQFNKLSRLENFSTIKRAIQNGLINDVKLIPPVSKADNRISFKKTQLVQRKVAAGEDSFKQVKATNTGQNIVSPDTDGVGGFTPAG